MTDKQGFYMVATDTSQVSAKCKTYDEAMAWAKKWTANNGGKSSYIGYFDTEVATAFPPIEVKKLGENDKLVKMEIMMGEKPLSATLPSAEKDYLKSVEMALNGGVPHT